MKLLIESKASLIGLPNETSSPLFGGIVDNPGKDVEVQMQKVLIRMLTDVLAGNFANAVGGKSVS